MTISETRQEIYGKMGKIPSWINTTSVIDHQVWDSMGELNDILLVLLTDKILKKKTVDKIIEKFDEIIEHTMEFTDYEKQIRIYVYYTTLIQHMIMRFQEEEHFETCTNLKLFNDSYFQNDNNDND